MPPANYGVDTGVHVICQQTHSVGLRFFEELDTGRSLHPTALHGFAQFWVRKEFFGSPHRSESVEHQHAIGVAFTLLDAFGDHPACLLDGCDGVVDLAPCLIVFDMMQNDCCGHGVLPSIHSRHSRESHL